MTPEAQHKIDLADALKRLFENKDFKLVIQEDYLKEYALQLVQLNAAQSAYLNKEFGEYLKAKLASIGALQNYFQAIIAEGESAREEANNDN